MALLFRDYTAFPFSMGHVLCPKFESFCQHMTPMSPSSLLPVLFPKLQSPVHQLWVTGTIEWNCSFVE